MTVVDWMASGTPSWILFGIGLLSAALAVLAADAMPPPTDSSWERSPYRSKVHVPPVYPYSRSQRLLRTLALIARWFSAVVGPLLLVGGTVAFGTSTNRQSWLIIISGAVCLFAGAYVSLRQQIAKAEHSADARQIATYVVDLLNDPPRRLQPPAISPAEIAEQVYQKIAKREMYIADPVTSSADNLVRAGRWVPVWVYTSANDGIPLKNALTAVLDQFEFTIAAELPPVRGSWWQRFWAHSKKSAQSEPMRQRLAKLEEAIQLEHLGKRRAEIDKAKAEAAAALLAAIKDQENAVIRIGSIIAIKAQGDLVVWTIGELEAAALEHRSDLLSDPIAALKFLRDGRKELGAPDFD